MKKNYLQMLVVLMTAILSVGVISCSKDDDHNNPLVGTKWVCYNHPVASIKSSIEGETYVFVIEFTSNTGRNSYFQSVKTGEREYLVDSDGLYEYVDDKTVIFIAQDRTRTTWYFLTPTELCNKKSKSESGATIYKRQ